MRSVYQEKLFYEDDLALFSESMEHLKMKIQAWKEALEPKSRN